MYTNKKLKKAILISNAAFKNRTHLFSKLPYMTHIEETIQLFEKTTLNKNIENECIAILLYNIDNIDIKTIQNNFGLEVVRLIYQINKILPKEDIILDTFIDDLKDIELTIILCIIMSNLYKLENTKNNIDYIKKVKQLIIKCDKKTLKEHIIILNKLKNMILYLEVLNG